MGLQTEGLIFLVVAWLSIFSLLFYCYRKVLINGRNRNKK